MNKIARFPLIIVTLLTVGCNLNLRHIETIEDDKGMKHIFFTVYPDFGKYKEDKVTLLLGSSLFPFKKEKYHIDTILVGDRIDIDFKGELYLKEDKMPSEWYMPRISIKNVTVTHSKIYEFEIIADSSGEQSIKCLSGEKLDFGYNYVINEDGTYLEHYNVCPVGTKLYGVKPAQFASPTILAFYSYNPLTD